MRPPFINPWTRLGFTEINRGDLGSRFLHHYRTNIQVALKVKLQRQTGTMPNDYDFIVYLQLPQTNQKPETLIELQASELDLKIKLQSYEDRWVQGYTRTLELFRNSSLWEPIIERGDLTIARANHFFWSPKNIKVRLDASDPRLKVTITGACELESLNLIKGLL